MQNAITSEIFEVKLGWSFKFQQFYRVKFYRVKFYRVKFYPFLEFQF